MKIKQKTLIRSLVCFLFCISLGFYSGFSFNLLAFLLIYFFLNIKDLKNKKFVLGDLFFADLLISLFILTINPNDLNGIVHLRGRLHHLSIILLPISIFLTYEYSNFLKKVNYDFEKFSTYLSSWPLLSIHLTDILSPKTPLILHLK